MPEPAQRDLLAEFDKLTGAFQPGVLEQPSTQLQEFDALVLTPTTPPTTTTTLPLDPAGHVAEFDRLQLERESQQPGFLSGARALLTGQPVEFDTSAGAKALRGVGLTIQEFNRGVAGSLGFIVDAADFPFQVLDAVTGASISGPSQGLPTFAQRFAETADVGLRAETTFEKMMMRAAEEVGASALPSMGLAGLAAKFVARGATPTGAMTNLLSDIARLGPEKFLRLEGTLAALSGAVGGAVASATDSDTWDMVATLVATVGFNSAFNIASLIHSKFSTRLTARKFRAEEIEELVAAEFDAIISKEPEIADNINRSVEALHRLGIDDDLTPSLGGLSRDPGARELTADILKTTPGAAGREQVRGARLDVALEEKLRRPGFAPEAGDIRGARGVVARGVVAEAKAEQRALLLQQTAADDIGEALDALTRRATDRAETAVQTLGPGLSRRGFGEAVDAEFATELNNLRDAVAPGYARIRTQAKSVNVDAQPLTREAQDILSEQRPFSRPGNVPATVEAVATNQQAVLGFDEVLDLREELLDQIRDLGGQPGANSKAIRNLNRMLGEVENIIDDVGSSTRAERIPGLRELNRFYREGKRRLSQGRAAMATQAGKRGKETARDLSAATDLFLRADTQSGAFEAAEDFQRAFGGQVGTLTRRAGDTVIPGAPTIGVNEQAMQALDQNIIGRMLETATDPQTQKVDPAKVRKFIATHKIALAQRPELAKRLSKVDEVQRLATEKTKRLEALAKQFNDEAIKPGPKNTALMDGLRREMDNEDAALRVVQDTHERAVARTFLEADPEKAIDDLLANPAQRRRKVNTILKKLEGDAKATAGFKRELWENLANRARGGTLDDVNAGERVLLDESNLRRMLDEFGDIIDDVYAPSPEQRAYLDSLATVVGANKRFGGASKLPDDQVEAMNVFISRLLSRVYSFQRGVISGRFLITEQVFRAINREATRVNDAALRRLLHEALYDPKVAKKMLAIGRSPNQKIMNKRVRAFLLSLEPRKREEEE